MGAHKYYRMTSALVFINHSNQKINVVVGYKMWTSMIRRNNNPIGSTHIVKIRTTLVSEENHGGFLIIHLTVLISHPTHTISSDVSKTFLHLNVLGKMRN